MLPSGNPDRQPAACGRGDGDLRLQALVRAERHSRGFERVAHAFLELHAGGTFVCSQRQAPFHLISGTDEAGQGNVQAHRVADSNVRFAESDAPSGCDQRHQAQASFVVRRVERMDDTAVADWQNWRNGRYRCIESGLERNGLRCASADAIRPKIVVLADQPAIVGSKTEGK